MKEELYDLLLDSINQEFPEAETLPYNRETAQYFKDLYQAYCKYFPEWKHPDGDPPPEPEDPVDLCKHWLKQVCYLVSNLIRFEKHLEACREIPELRGLVILAKP
jgi:hypothetical protein